MLQRSAVVLAAGGSTRWGGRPKALLEVEGEPAVRRIARVCTEEGYDPVIVVAGESEAKVAAALEGTRAALCPNRTWAEGRTGSVQAGLTRLPPKVEVLLWPVDHPFVEAMTLRELERAAHRDLMASWWIPTFGGRAGHPVRWRAQVTPLIANLSPSAPLRTILPRLGPQVSRVPVDDPGVVENVDTPEEYDRAVLRYHYRRDRP